MKKKNLDPNEQYSFRYKRVNDVLFSSPSDFTGVAVMPAAIAPLFAQTLSSKFINPQGGLVDYKDLSGKVVAVYSSAHW